MDDAVSLANPKSARPLKIEVMLKRLLLAFTSPYGAAYAHDQTKSDREIVQMHAHGNIRLQQGQFYTKKDVDAKFRRLQKVDFVG